MDEIKQIFRDRQFKKLFVGDTDNTLIQFFRYLFVGGLATVVDWGLSFILFKFVFGERFAVAANSLSFIAGLVVNYLISTLWVFKNSKVSNKLVEFIGFAAIGVVGLLITVLITWCFRLWLEDRTSAYQMIAKVVSTAVAFLWNFFARKILLYTKNENKK